MLLFILKSSACLAVFMLFYKLLLERESAHTFKRFYLLGALVSAILIPLITFTTYIEATPIELPVDTFEMATAPYVPEQILAVDTSYLAIILWCVYLLGVLIFSIRFGKNLYNIVKRIKQNPKFKNRFVFHVLLTELVPPHTFLNYIFFNKEKYEAHEIPKEVFLHEETHAKEKHALDILFVEVLQILFWFNPLLYFVKKDIKLNHEFLADKAVLKNGVALENYQNTLLAFSSHASEPQLANAINYSSIKKRFTLMKTHTSKTAIWVRSLILMPLLAILIYSFSSTKLVEKDMASESLIANHTARSIDINVLDNGTYEIDGITATKKTFVSVINQLHQDIIPEIRNQIINIHINNGKAVSDEAVWFIYNSVIDYGFHRIVTYNQEIIREKGNKPYTITSIVSQEPLKAITIKAEQQKRASKEQIAEYNKIAKHCSSQIKNKGIVKHKDVERLKYLYNLMTPEQRKTSEPFPDFSKLPPPPPPADATPEQSAQYKTWNEEYYNKNKSKDGKVNNKSMVPPPPPPPISKDATPEQLAKYKKVQEEYKTKYSVSNGKVSKNPPPPPPPVPHDATPEQKAKYKKVSEEYYKKYQLKDGKVYYKNPPPPPPTSPTDDTPKTGFIDINGEKSYYATVNGKTKYYNRWGKEIDKEGKELTGIQTDGDQVIPNQNISKVYQNDQIVSDFNKNWESNNGEQIPPPPPPISALDFVIAMAKKDNAMFFYEGRTVSSEKAISVVKQNPDLNISAKNSESDNPRVFITKEPVNQDPQDFESIPKPTAENAVSHIKVMNRHGAKFYLDGKEVTYEEALKAVQKNKNADINSTVEPPVVNIKN